MRKQFAVLAAGCLTLGLMAVLGSAQMDKASKPSPAAKASCALADGKTVTGRRLNEDTLTVQLIDEQEHLLSLSKADLRQYAVVMTSPMPPYKDKLTSQDVADLVSYLLSLKGVQ